MKIVIADGLAPEGIDRLRPRADVVVGAAGDALRDADAVIVRSRTQVTREVIERAPRLKVIARAGVGTDNIDVEAATHRGILVLNTPESSSVSTAEHTLALLLALARHLPAAHAATVQGQWERERFTGVELYGKTLGIVGLGNIGSEVSRRAAALGMRVIAFDPYVSPDRASRVGAELVAWETVLEHSDIITLHVPLAPATRHLIGSTALARMRPGVRLINCARGGLIDEAALLDALDAGRVAGAALDVFEAEPPRDRRLLEHPAVVVTPHLGASTQEAQRTVAVDVADQVLAALAGLPARGAVNAPAMPADVWSRIQPYVQLARVLGALARQLVVGQVLAVECTYEGEVAHEPAGPLLASCLAGLLETISDPPVNIVNAVVVARERGIALTEIRREHSEDFSSLLQVRVQTSTGAVVVGGTLFGRHEPRITHLDGYRIDLVPAAHMLFVWNMDRPGMIGRVGTILGGHRVNIAGMQVGRLAPGGSAVMVLSVDTPVPEAIIREIARVDGITGVTAVNV